MNILKNGLVLVIIILLRENGYKLRSAKCEIVAERHRSSEGE